MVRDSLRSISTGKKRSDGKDSIAQRTVVRNARFSSHPERTLFHKFHLASLRPVSHLPEEIEKLRRERQSDEHRIPLDDLTDRLGTDLFQGLSTEEALDRFRINGANILSPSHQSSFFVVFTKEMFSGFSLLLWLGSLLCFSSYGVHRAQGDKGSDELMLGIVLASVTVFSAFCSYHQTTKSAKIIESFKYLMPPEATVLRDGEWTATVAKELVVGDVVEVEAGESVPADLRIFQSDGLMVDDSALTGELDPHKVSADRSDETNALDAYNLIFMSSYAIQGSGRGVVINTGDRTLLGRLATLAGDVEVGETPIGRETNNFVHLITALASCIGVMFVVYGIIIGLTPLEIILNLIAIMVCTVPEGLLATITISLSVSAKKMTAKNCTVKNLEAVETLGSTSVILCDKTGTLTQNVIQVAHLWYDDFLIDGPSFLLSDPVNRQHSESLKRLLRVVVLCNRATVRTRRLSEAEEIMEEYQADMIMLHGSAAETALLKFVEDAMDNPEAVYEFRDNSRKVCDIPFNFALRFQVSVHEMSDNRNHFMAAQEPDEGRYLLVLSGAPERVLGACKEIFIHGRKLELTPEWIQKITVVFEKLASAGERVQAFCEYHLPDGDYPDDHRFKSDLESLPLDKLCLLGLVSLFDPPRPSVPEAVRKCRVAGVRVIMITGGHPIAARAIARQVGIFKPEHYTVEDIADVRGIDAKDVDPSEAQACIIHGNSLKRLSAEQLDHLINRYPDIIFARTTPQQKVLIVESLQRLNYVVAVTGNSINDSPALKKANIGIAMGLSGSDISKEAADMILLDDNFATIIMGIEEGRLIFENLKKLVAYTLSSNMTQLIPVLLAILAKMPFPLGTITVFCIDLGTDALPAISLTQEESEIFTMTRPPRNPVKDRLVSYRLYGLVYCQIGILEACAGMFTYFVVMADHGFRPYQLFGLRTAWESEVNHDLVDAYGQEWHWLLTTSVTFAGKNVRPDHAVFPNYRQRVSVTGSVQPIKGDEQNYPQREMLQYQCYSAYFICVLMVQFAGIIIFKTRVNSIFHQGMRNKLLNFALCFETGLLVLLIYTPWLNRQLQFYPARINYWITPIFWAVLLLLYDEFRKYQIRHRPGGFFDRETLY